MPRRPILPRSVSGPCKSPHTFVLAVAVCLLGNASALWPSSESDLVLRPARGPKADVAALLLSDMDSGTLDVAAVALPRYLVGQDRFRADLWVEIDAYSLLPEEPSALTEDLRLDLHVYALHAEGVLSGSLSRWVRLPHEALAARRGQGGVQLTTHLDLPVSPHQLRLLVREPASGRFALRRLEVVSPGDGTWLAPPIFPGGGEDWIQVGDGEASLPPPAALPVLLFDRRYTMVLRGSDADWQARLVHGSGTTLELPLTRLGAANPETFERHVGFTLPTSAETTPAGTWRLELLAPTRFINGSSSAQAILPIFLLPPERLPPGLQAVDPPPKLLWPSIRTLLAGSPSTQAVQSAWQPSESSRQRKAKEAITDAYRGILRRLLDGDFDRAAEALCELETNVVGTAENPLQARKWLDEGQRRVTEEVAEGRSEVLLPLLHLHLTSHGLYLERRARDPLLLNGARNHILFLARNYASRTSSSDRSSVGDAMARSLVASALAQVGIAIDRAGSPNAGRRMLEEAFVLDDGNAGMLLYTAYWYERRGEYPSAIQRLERLLRSDPSEAQGRLRLALSLWRGPCRLEDDRQSACVDTVEGHLRRLLTEAEEPWLNSLAHQELARLLMFREDFEAAVALLQHAVARLPSERRLFVQLAYALERTGRGLEAHEILAKAPTSSPTVTPRHRYSLPPQGFGPRLTAQRQRQALARLPLLAQALAPRSSTP